MLGKVTLQYTCLLYVTIELINYYYLFVIRNHDKYAVFLNWHIVAENNLVVH